MPLSICGYDPALESGASDCGKFCLETDKVRPLGVQTWKPYCPPLLVRKSIKLRRVMKLRINGPALGLAGYKDEDEAPATDPESEDD